MASRGPDPMRADERTSVLFALPPGGVTPWFAEHLGTAYLRTVLLRAGIASAQYLPPRNPSLAGFARALRERRPAIVGFTAYESNLRACRAMARVVRETLPEAIVAVGGPNATFSPEETLELLGADLCLRGAGEGTIATIAGAIRGAGSPRGRLPELLADVPNLVLATEEGARYTRVGDLSSFPAEHFGCMDDLPSPYQAGLVETADVGIMTARGCNQHCTYCSFAAISGRRVHHHGVERVLEDLAAFRPLVDRVERRRAYVPISDDAFTLAPERARAICEGIVARGLQLPFDCETRADRVDLELLRLMRRAGFQGISFGLESAVPHVLRAIGKVQDPASRDDPGLEAERAYLARFREAVALAKAAGLTPAVSVIGGLPGESEEDFRETLRFVASLDVPVYGHNVLSLHPGTPLFAERERHGIAAERDATSGQWRTRHAYPVSAVRPLPTSSTHVALWNEASELADALCGRPRLARAADDGAWAVVFHAGTPEAAALAWLRDVLAVSGIVVAVDEARALGTLERREWVRGLNRAEVPFGTFALVSREDAASSDLLRALGAIGEHRVELLREWRSDASSSSDEAGRCRIPIWLASTAAGSPPRRGARPLRPAPQIADGCRWWSRWRRCRSPRVLHAWPDGRVTACWRGPALGRVGEPYAVLAARGAAAGTRDGCPVGAGEGRAPRGRARAAETWEIASQLGWLFRNVVVTSEGPPPGGRAS